MEIRPEGDNSTDNYCSCDIVKIEKVEPKQKVKGN